MKQAGSLPACFCLTGAIHELTGQKTAWTRNSGKPANRFEKLWLEAKGEVQMKRMCGSRRMRIRYLAPSSFVERLKVSSRT
jgi:hypothetical protein